MRRQAANFGTRIVTDDIVDLDLSKHVFFIEKSTVLGVGIRDSRSAQAPDQISVSTRDGMVPAYRHIRLAIAAHDIATLAKYKRYAVRMIIEGDDPTDHSSAYRSGRTDSSRAGSGLSDRSGVRSGSRCSKRVVTARDVLRRFLAR